MYAIYTINNEAIKSYDQLLQIGNTLYNRPMSNDRTLAAIEVRPKFCSLPAESGLCLAAILRWYYNEKTGRCETFSYGGCGGNENNFKTEKECVKTCKPKCPPLPCLKFIKCAYGMATDEKGCTICKCNNPCEVRPLVMNMQEHN